MYYRKTKKLCRKSLRGAIYSKSRPLIWHCSKRSLMLSLCVDNFCKPSFFYTINCLQILAELVSGGQVFFVKIVRRGAAADIQPAHDLPAEIVGHEVKRSVRAGGSLLILIGHRGEENDLLFAHQRFIVGVKAVDDRLELGVEVKIIDRRDEDDRIGLGKVRLSSFMSSASNVHSLVRTHLSQPMQGCTSLNAASKRKTSCPALSAPRWN